MERKWLVYCLVLTIFYIPSLYLIGYLLTPPDYVFISLGNPDKTMQLAAMKSYIWQFKNPYFVDDTLIFHNPIVGSVYLLPFLFFPDVMIIFESVFFFFYLVVSFVLIRYLIKSKKERNITFLFFTLIYSTTSILYFWAIGDYTEFSHISSFGQFQVSASIYYSASLIFAYLGLFSPKKFRIESLLPSIFNDIGK